ncbi:hypothetical protein [Kutzneria chonburiensis]|uniref:Uncharacterized protein n=1 Tax=Kutzneria chonburiensis TaxID=1483604 RepID=A0ABV6MK37_9PSEU|nr:hypothetical protein [Kutzneria chonburiensis]
MNTDYTTPSTAEDFLDLARQTLIAKAVPDQRHVQVAATYDRAAEMLSRNPSALPDLLCAHQRLCDALDDSTPGTWQTQQFAADTWVSIADTTVQARRRATRQAEQVAAERAVFELPHAADIDGLVP